MSHYGLSVGREQNTNSFHVLVLTLQTTAPQQKGKNSIFSAVLSFSWATQEQGVNWEPSLCVALVCLTAFTKIRFLRFKEIPLPPPPQKNDSNKKYLTKRNYSYNIKTKASAFTFTPQFCLHGILIAETLKCTYLCTHTKSGVMLPQQYSSKFPMVWFYSSKACISRMF